MAALATACGVAMSVLRTVEVSAAATPGFVYALVDRSGAANQLYGFSLDASGVLALLPGFPISTGGNGSGTTTSENLVFDPVRGRVYAINGGSNTVSAFGVNRATGAVTILPFSLILPRTA
jgi:DNA-binding beta-propeller fold protein YncE